MTYRPRKACRWCGIPRAEAGGLSHSGACKPCGEKRLADNIAGIQAGKGPEHERWVLGMLDAIARLGGGNVTLPIPDYVPLENTRTRSRR